ncbi:MAG: bifunctional metallophosphatase/5'-nucleotidase [Alistipes sp.]|nr:bifunctional metallophosphatase/5'-nucleotidase [Alistipes sp.]
MKKSLSFISLARTIAGIALGLLTLVGCRSERQVVILSTNDIHAAIDNFPRLATAVAACRDTVDVVLVDAGDRWTGNVFVDRSAEPRRPIIDLMNRLGYDAVTFGNHEFDVGQAYLGKMVGLSDFQVVCANVVSDTCTFPQPEPYAIIERNGVKFGFLGVVTNYSHNDHPDGRDESFVGLTFCDPIERALELGPELAARCDVPVLLSHMGGLKDFQFASRPESSPYSFVIGGHSHQKLDTLVNGLHIGQSLKNLQYVGAHIMTFKGKKCTAMEFRNIPLADYDEEPEYAALVAEIESDPVLHASAGTLTSRINKVGLADFFIKSALEATGAKVVFYHRGGIRKDALEQGSVTIADVYNLDPFASRMHNVYMTREQMERMVIAKFNDTKNIGESHCVDLFSNVPYTICTDERGEAVSVLFPTLLPGVHYETSLCNYVYENYDDVEYVDIKPDAAVVTDMLFDYLRRHSPAAFSNDSLQVIRRTAVRDL